LRRPRKSLDYREYYEVLRYRKGEKVLEDFSYSGRVKVALIFPNKYNIASSSMSFSFVAKLFNESSIACERFFHEGWFRKYYSLETQSPLDEFRIWAFSVHYELDFFNVLELLKNKGIPLSWRERNKDHPLIIVGGALTYFAPFMFWEVADAIYHGDLEEYFEKFVESLLMDEKGKILSSLLEIPSVSIPPEGKVFKRLATCRNLEDNPPYSHVIPSHGEFSKRLLVEVGRGCIRRCKFCVAGHTQKPVRFIKPNVFEKIVEKYREEKFGLISATITDYPWLDELLNILERYSIKFSVSSMRMDGLNLRLLKLLKKSGQRTFTVAPEGGSQKIRDILGKDIEEKDIENALKMGRNAGFNGIKMYFIYGLEEEEEEDLLAIKELADFARSLGYTKITLSLNPLIPKPRTPFEKRAMLPFHILREKFLFLKKILRDYRLTFEGIRESILQYRLAFADESLSKEWVKIYEKFGAKELKRRILKS